MSKAWGNETNFRVVVTPRGLGDFGCIRTSDSFICPDPARRAAKYRELCEEIGEQVRRHVDSVAGVDIEFDREAFCSHCGSEWTERDDTYNGGCCAEDEAGNPTPDPQP